MEEVTSAFITPYLHQITENWLDQKINYPEWRHILDSFNGFPNLKLNVDSLLAQEEQLKIAARKKDKHQSESQEKQSPKH